MAPSRSSGKRTLSPSASVGIGKDKTLVVDTSRINWPYFDRSGAARKPGTWRQRTFDVAQNGNRLDYVMT